MAHILSDVLEVAERTRLDSLATLAVLCSVSAPTHAQSGAGSVHPPALVGHWRMTEISGGQPIDEHLVLGADGRLQNWTVTALSRGEPAAGRWRVEGRRLVLQLRDAQEGSAPFTIYEGRLVFPNIDNRRKFWDRL